MAQSRHTEIWTQMNNDRIRRKKRPPLSPTPTHREAADNDLSSTHDENGFVLMNEVGACNCFAAVILED